MSASAHDACRSYIGDLQLIYRRIYRLLPYREAMHQLTVNEPAETEVPGGYRAILVDVARLIAELQLAVDAARHCGPYRETAVLVDLHNRVRSIAARLNQALAGKGTAESSP